MEHIFKWVKFHTLDLSCAELDYDVYVILFEIISYYDTFKKIKIKFNKISQALCIQFTKMLKNTPCIDIIEICNGTLPLVFWDLLRMRMADNWTLKEIMLNNVPLSNKCLSFLANTICSSNHVKLKKLYLRNAKLVSVIQGDTIALIAKNCHSLQYLDLSGNNLSQKLNLLFQVLSTGCSNIKILYLMNNSLSEPDFKQLSQIKSTCPLNYLCLDSNNLSGSSFHHIVDLINSNDSIIYLSMVNCKLCDYEAISLAETIHDNGTLQNINISCNNFGLAGIIALERAIQFNNIILYIAITNNPNIYNSDEVTKNTVWTMKYRKLSYRHYTKKHYKI
ncbi:hypothetical protein A3Q56_05030 [Intoshia linei]|uniref:Leucine-rich repeat-containing protein 34 n=1 Tax=Intoshia linei TaxID=1819745 RepID=A0A177AYX5_9BILA|nr:hypothetical protein A3Q56_05030 [Intoshia linei]